MHQNLIKKGDIMAKGNTPTPKSANTNSGGASGGSTQATPTAAASTQAAQPQQSSQVQLSPWVTNLSAKNAAAQQTQPNQTQPQQAAQTAQQQNQNAQPQPTAQQLSTPSNATSPNVKSYFGDNNGGFKNAKDLVANQSKILSWMDAATAQGGINTSTQTAQWYAAEMMGFNAKPNVVNSMSSLPNQANRVMMYRGVSSNAAYAQQFKTGDNFAGVGIYGDGAYFQLSYAGAQMYAGTSNKAHIISASVDTSKLKIVSLADLKKERAKILKNPKTSPRVKQLIKKDGTMTDAKGNNVYTKKHGDGALGTLATLLGYDAIYVPGGNGGKVAQSQPTNAGKNNDFYVILNRGAIDVKAGY